MSHHTLKINPEPFADILSGVKTSEIRYWYDRDLKVGDTVLLVEFAEGEVNPSGRRVERVITHIQRGYGLPHEYCVLSYASPTVEPIILSDEELTFLKVIARNPGGKLNGGEAWGSEGKSVWPRLEELGLIVTTGSYKWRATFDAVELGVQAALTTLAKKP